MRRLAAFVLGTVSALAQGVASTPLTIAAGSAADVYSTGGTPWTVPPGPPAPAPGLPTLRYGTSFKYDIPVVSGLYAVSLVFAEPNAAAPGARVFTAAINGQVSPPIDVFALTHADNAPYTFVGYALAGAGGIHLQFTGLIGNAIVSQIQVTGVLFGVAAGTVPIATLAATNPGALYFTLDGINAVTLCVAATQTPGCPGAPAAAAMVPLFDATGKQVGTTPLYAYSAQDAQGITTGPAFWIPMLGAASSTVPAAAIQGQTAWQLGIPLAGLPSASRSAPAPIPQQAIPRK